jgi:hypothetical protein
MSRTKRRNRLAAHASLGLALTVLPAYTATAADGLSAGSPSVATATAATATAAPCPPQAPPYVVYRPILSRLLTPKTLTLANYAGANYPSARPGAVVTPTEFRALTGRPRRGWHGFSSGW